MAAIERIDRPVFRAPTKGRCYLTAKSAAEAESRALMNKKYPPEKAEYENGMMYYPGFHWNSDEHLVRVQDRLARLILRAFRAQTRKAT